MLQPFILNEFIDVPVPFGMDSWLSFWLVLVVAIVNGIIMLFVGYKFLQVIQLSGYKTKGYFEWLKSTRCKYMGRLVVLSFLSTAALLVTNVLLNQFFVYKILTYLGLIFYFLFCTIFIINMFNAPQKVPLKYTKRMARLLAVLFVLVMVFTFFIMMGSYKFVKYLEYGALGLTPVFLPVFVLFAFWITAPFEHLNSLRYIKKSKIKLESMKNLTVVGITGSYGKTSVKNILGTLLSEKYKVCSTPYSYNTPLGLSKTILENLNSSHEVFVAEMGAKYVGDIKYLCDMVKPSVGILTGIGNQHLATFGSKENIVKTKGELVEAVSLSGKSYINTESVLALGLFNSAGGVKYEVNVNNTSGRVFATNIETGSSGTSFDLVIDGNVVSVQTSLLGRHNVSNILICALASYDLGLTLEEIKNGISKLTPSSHRLAIVPSSNNLVVIDDAYNGSVEGAKAALDVIKEFSGRKIVITPGLVELGVDEFKSNYNLGKDMAEVADFVIIDGTINYAAISSGLIDSGFNAENILRAGSIKQAVEVLGTFSRPGDVVLFENDLPDNYT